MLLWPRPYNLVEHYRVQHSTSRRSLNACASSWNCQHLSLSPSLWVGVHSCLLNPPSPSAHAPPYTPYPPDMASFLKEEADVLVRYLSFFNDHESYMRGREEYHRESEKCPL